MPLVQITVEDRQRLVPDKFGFRPRYSLPIESKPHANDVVSTFDRLMGFRTKAPGVYQATYDEVRGAYQTLLDEVPPDRMRPYLRTLAFFGAMTLLLVMCFVLPFALFGFLLMTALRRQSGFEAMYEGTILWRLLDWRPTIRRLLDYALNA